MASSQQLLDFCVELSQLPGQPGNYQHCIAGLAALLNSQAIAILRRQGDVLIPVAMSGLSGDTMGRRFLISSHPRFAQIVAAERVVRFPFDCELPDPFDGLLHGREGNLPVHSCMGMPIRDEHEVIGVVTFDSLDTGVFEVVDDSVLDGLSQALSGFFLADKKIHELTAQVKQSAQLKEALSRPENLTDINEFVGHSQRMVALKREISLVAPTDYAVLVTGESGTGKELVAHEIHRQSHRRAEPLIYVNCAALPDNLVESELFGHVKGAFTGADTHRAGKFKIADGGTLFLDEIGELPLASQAKLLRVLQSQEIQPLGQDVVEQVDVRVIAATNRNLEQEVELGHFRADLYHRLNVYPVAIPPLKARQGDVSLLSGFFIEKLRRKLGLSQLRVDQMVMDKMQDYDWPGNVRELEHFLSRAALKAASGQGNPIVSIRLQDCENLKGAALQAASNEVATVADLPAQMTLRGEIDKFQYGLIKQVLIEESGNWTRAAKRLNVDRANLSRLAKRLGISVSLQVN